MSLPKNQFFYDILNDTEDVADMEFLDLQSGTLEDFLEPFKTNEDFKNMSSPSSALSDNYAKSSLSVPFNHNAAFPRLQMVEQPFQSSKLRYRTDYIRETGRVGALGNKSPKSKPKGPAIHIPDCYLNTSNDYYIRVSLVTVKYNKTNLHYFHPYELEHAKNQLLNDRSNNSVWFSIGSKDSIKSFPSLRIVKKKAFEVQKLDPLRVFDYHSSAEILPNSSFSQYSWRNEIDIMKEFNLEKSHLAFTLGEKILLDGQAAVRLYFDTTIFSDPMDENDDKPSDTDTDTESSSDRTMSSSSNSYVYKYAPHSGFNESNDEMLIFLKKKLDTKRSGNLKIIFQYDTYQGQWSKTIEDLDIKDRMIVFKIPNYPYVIQNPITVDVILRQNYRILTALKYSYLPLDYSR